MIVTNYWRDGLIVCLLALYGRMIVLGLPGGTRKDEAPTLKIGISTGQHPPLTREPYGRDDSRLPRDGNGNWPEIRRGRP